MSDGKKGILILKELPGGEAEKKVLAFLLRFTKKTAAHEQLRQKIKNTPFVLSKDIPLEKANLISEALHKLGASTTFVPHTSDRRPPAEEAPAYQRSKMYTSIPQSTLDKEPLPDQRGPKKNAARRRITLLTIILLILSLGFLAWQFYPLISEKLQSLGIG